VSEEGFSGRQAAGIAGITYRQLDYWARTDLIRPSLADAKGSGSRRRYSYKDLVELKMIKTLLDAGQKLERVRAAFEYLRDLGDDLSSAQLVIAGAREIDMVIHIGALLEGDSEYVRRDIAAVVDAVGQASVGSALVKVILETGFLDEPHIIAGCAVAKAAGADFVKTSTGFGPRGASVEDVRIMRSAVGDAMGVKAAGGIRDLAAALAMLEAGADRLGTSAGSEILEAFSQSTAGSA